ncbi:MAG: hypothetical protein A3I11_05090 [Elusimicrobia bacterium RIFCSPLOWO2_02_FULL_39_32]|nr:MAG: hypothetical protein A3B80_00515 [Elusimicrobia bacterium RIFCSPHIGHO2_02_FULL_39_36]OGR91128.1 MAG: hypothetical protein A3I11_05090 [Elusimicrobia bacterium RIFCSPLOWO2_02_FULL_39_32]OGS00095.1 MAG: hypothetical protein A3G85_08055 [Elusimicrobia bacterium RIFCSPLOWO2_12_FULL_39_28]
MKRLAAFIIISFLFCFCVISQQTSARAEDAGNNEDATESKAAPIWAHDFNQMIYKIEALPNGFLAVTSGPKKKERKSEKNEEEIKLWLLDGRNGNVVWNEPEKGNQIIAGNPHPIVVKQDENSLNLKAMDRSGGEVWSNTHPGVSLSAAVDQEQNQLILLESEKSWWDQSKEQNVTLKVISLNDGTLVWQAELGAFRLPIVIPSTVMQITPKSIWIAAGGKVLSVNRETRSVAFNQILEATLEKESSPNLEWHATDQFAALALDNGICFLNADKGLAWSKTFKKMIPDTVAFTETMVVAGYRIPKRERSKVLILAYDRKSGEEKWRYQGRDGMMAKWDRVQAPPIGLAVSEDRVALALKNSLIGLDTVTGKIAYKTNLKKKNYTYAKQIERWKDLVIIHGALEIRAHDLMSGKLKWRINNFGAPKDYAQRNQKLSAGLMKIGFQAAASMQEFSAQSMQSLANTKVGGKSGSHYSHYVFSPSARYQLTSAAQQAGRSSAWYKVGASDLEFTGLSRWIEIVHYAPDTRLHVQPKVVDTNIFAFMPFRIASIAAVSLKDGTYKEALPLKAASSCITALCVDMAEGLLYYANHKLAPACTKYKHIQAYKIPKNLQELDN